MPVRFSFISRDQNKYFGQQLVKINKDDKFVASIEFGKGKFSLKTKKHSNLNNGGVYQWGV